MDTINTIIKELLKTNKPVDIADTLNVSSAMISTWKNTDNDFSPRITIARKIYKSYGKQVWPYDIRALR